MTEEITTPKRKRRRRHKKIEHEEVPMYNIETSPYVIEPVPSTPAKRILRPINGGASRGARQNRTAFVEFNRDSSQAVIEPKYVDVAPGKAFDFIRESLEVGLFARALEGRVEDIVLAERGMSTDPIILNLDRASALANVLRTTADVGRPTLGYLLLKLPSGRLWAVRFVLEPRNDVEPGNDGARASAIAFFERLADVSERNTSNAVVGDDAEPEHRLLEPRIREWFAEHTKTNLAKIIAGVEPASNTFEVTNGHDTSPLIISLQQRWTDPLALAETVLENPPVPIRRGMQFVLAEVTPDGIRFHEVRRRTDDRVTVGGAEVIDRVAVEAQATLARREEERRIAREALARATRETLSRRNPVMTTD